MNICKNCGKLYTSMKPCCPENLEKKLWKIYKPYSIPVKSLSHDKEAVLTKDQLKSAASSNVKNLSTNYLQYMCQTVVPLDNISEVVPSSFPQFHSIMSSTNKERGMNPKSLPPFCQFNLTQVADDLPQEWLTNVTNYLLRDLNHFGFSVIDNFLGTLLADKVLSEVFALQVNGVLVDGETVAPKVNTHGMVRGDKIAWISGLDQGCASICKFVSTLNAVVAYANHHENAGLLKNFNIAYRTRAMVACYPGSGSRYVKHVDNPDGDGRCITAIYYVNKKWKRENGGVLRIYPKGSQNIAQIEPIFDRMLFFWSDRRNPHEVLPSSCMRYAITVWYIDQEERQIYEQRCLQQVSSSSRPVQLL